MLLLLLGFVLFNEDTELDGYEMEHGSGRNWGRGVNMIKIQCMKLPELTKLFLKGWHTGLER